jgi:hypothetical protein
MGKHNNNHTKTICFNDYFQSKKGWNFHSTLSYFIEKDFYLKSFK